MNALSPTAPAPANLPAPIIPDSAPFSAAQRAWLNGFLAGLYGPGAAAPAGLSAAAAPAAPEEEFPWHDPALEMPERLALAEGRALPRRLMAAMAQLDCGQCGYLCQTYAEALAEGREASAALCVPGAKPTQRMLKQILAEAPAAMPVAAIAVPVAAVTVPMAPAKPVGMPVRVLSAAPLTTPDSAKDVRHVVIDLAESGLAYLPGDSLSLIVPNHPDLVALCLSTLGASGAELVPCADGVTRDLRSAFTQHLDIARPLDRTLDLLAMAATHAPHAKALRRLADGEDDAEPAEADLADLLAAFGSARPPITDLVHSLPVLKPRLYSIASSLRAAPGQVHLCVSVVRAHRRGRARLGVASGFLADRAMAHGAIPGSIQTSHFRLPTDPATPIIMCGPGTGIAPFRAFLQDRAARGIKGQSWLFFGDQKAGSDFLYRDEIQTWRQDGTLARLDTAFSRDQAQKIYVQDRMRENAADLWRWLQNGAHFYVCGDASRMARDVDACLRAIARSEGGLDEAQARDWMIALARQGRYLRDVY